MDTGFQASKRSEKQDAQFPFTVAYSTPLLKWDSFSFLYLKMVDEITWKTRVQIDRTEISDCIFSRIDTTIYSVTLEDESSARILCILVKGPVHKYITNYALLQGISSNMTSKLDG